MLPTQNLYQTVDRTQYEAIKQRHINASLPGRYDLLSLNRDKWQALMNQFVISMPDDANTIRNFCQARLDTVEGPSKIRLADCINYFEQFYFLYTTTDPLFKLNQAEKNALKVLLLEGMGYACEPGKQERFESALVLYRRDTNWINGRLSQARYHVLEGLAERCNQALAIPDGHSPHTIKFMKGLAEEMQLGIDREAALTDIYRIDRVGITKYFRSHYRADFHAYEACAADDLSQQLLNEFTDFLRGKVNTTQWEQEGIIIPFPLMVEFNRFFESKSFDAVMGDLRDDSDDENLKLKKKADFFTGLRSLIKKKLLENGYYVSMANLHALPSENLPLLPTWHRGVSMQDLVAVAKAIENATPNLSATHNQCRLILSQYPRVLLLSFERKPERLSAFPVAFQEEIKSLSVLYGAGPVSALKLMRSLAQRVTPAELLMIVQYRRQNDLSPLPYCEHLEAFHQELTTAGIVWAANGDSAVKAQAQAVPGIDTALHEASAVGYLARTDHWYMALVLHHHANQLAFQTWAQFFKRLQKIMKAVVQSLAAILTLLALVLALIVVGESIMCLFMLPPLGLCILMAWAAKTLFGALFGAAIAGSPLCGLIISYLITYCLYDEILFTFRRSEEYLRININPFFEDLIRAQSTQLCDSMHAVATHLYALIAGVFATVFSPAPPLSMDTLAARCERSIERLLFTKEDASAHQKGALLATLWDKVQAEGSCDTEVTLNARLNKKHEVTYQGQRRSLSFSEVAATKRVHSDRFNLDEPPSVYGFFAKARSTTTDSMLEPRPAMGLAA